MKTRKIASFLGAVFAGAMMIAGSASAVPVTCGSDQRTATVDPATSCITGNGNLTRGRLQSIYGVGFDNAGRINRNTGTDLTGLFQVDRYLALAFFDGGFNDTSANAIFSIASSFWDSYASGVLTMRVTRGGGNPDFFSWVLDGSQSIDGLGLAGAFNYDVLSGRGGRLIDVRLWGSESAISIPAPAPFALLMFGLALLGAGRVSKR